MQSPESNSRACGRTDIDDAEIRSLQRDVRSNDHLVALTSFMKTAGSDTRMRILYLLWTKSELCVCELAEVLDLTPPAISQQLKKLRGKALVERRREAQTIYYSLCRDNAFTRMLARLFEEQAADEVVLQVNGLEG